MCVRLSERFSACQQGLLVVEQIFVPVNRQTQEETLSKDDRFGVARLNLPAGGETSNAARGAAVVGRSQVTVIVTIDFSPRFHDPSIG